MITTVFWSYFKIPDLRSNIKSGNMIIRVFWSYCIIPDLISNLGSGFESGLDNITNILMMEVIPDLILNIKSGNTMITIFWPYYIIPHLISNLKSGSNILIQYSFIPRCCAFAGLFYTEQ